MNAITRMKGSMASAAARAINWFGRSRNSGFFSGFSLLSGSKRNWSKDAGPRYDNSAVFAVIQYLTAQITGDPRLEIQKEGAGANGKLEWVGVKHELPRIIRRGSVMNSDQLFAGVLISLVVDGNGYWIKDRLPNGRVIGFVYAPHWQMTAVRDRPSPFGDRPADGSHLVNFYEFKNADGSIVPFRVEDVIHFRWGVDPARPEYGLSPIFASLREIVTDNEAATLGAALLSNAGIPGVAISPKEKIPNNLTPEQRSEVNSKFKTRITGDLAGTPFIAPFACEFTVIGFSPDKLVLGQTRALARSTIFSSFRIDAMVLGFPSEQKTYSNFEEAARAAWRKGCKPVLRLLSEAIDEQCYQTDYLPPSSVGDAESRVYWDLTEVAEEQEDKYKEADMLRADWEADGIMRSELRAARGFAVDPTRDDIFYSAAKPQPVDPLKPEPTDTPAKKKKREVEEEFRERVAAKWRGRAQG